MLRHRQFVGRSEERSALDALLAEDDPCLVVHLYGPGGIGKTTLLHEVAYACEERGRACARLDARYLHGTPQGFLLALSQALGLPDDAAPLDALPPGGVVLVDTYELLAPLDAWIRDIFVPDLPERAKLVLAGRGAPATGWRSDPGWMRISRPLALRNFTLEDSRAYLQARGVPAAQHRAVMDFTHGHPLALSLVADAFAQRPEMRFRPEAAPDIVAALLEQFVQKVPGPAHRAALEAAALVRVVTESLLAELLATPDAHALFDWLRGLSFVEAGPAGLFPHDLAREALAADVRWRNPDWFAALHGRARAYYMRRLGETSGASQQHVLLDYIFLHRDNPVVRPFFEWQSRGTIRADALRPGDDGTIAAMVAAREGPASAAAARHWLARQPQSYVVMRDASGDVAGFFSMLSLADIPRSDAREDPAVVASLRYLNEHRPLRPGERATLFRHWMSRDAYQGVSAAQSLIFIDIVLHYLTTPGLAYTFLPVADPAFWAAPFAYACLDRVPDADFATDGTTFAVYGHDWREMPPLAWLTVLAEREMQDTTGAVRPAATPTVLVMSRDEFEGAVRDGLRNLHRPDLLAANPLLRSRLLIDRAPASAPPAARVDALRETLREAIGVLEVGRTAKAYRALIHTYVDPAPTQEQAAERLDVPFSTYRRHLKSGIDEVVDLLWRKELGG